MYYRILGFLPRNLEIYEQACLHRSSSVKSGKGKWLNNERLEFLGDAVLDAIVADILYNEFKSKKEGFLTNTRSKIVQREMLNKIALQMGLDKFIVTATRMHSHNSYIYGNAFEALVGAIYLDRGYDVCKKFIRDRVIKPYIDLSRIARTEINFKSKLIEWGQKNKVDIVFELIESFLDPENNPMFQFRALLAGMEGGTGIGYSKKESQQNASQMALKKIKNDKSFVAKVRAAQAEIRASRSTGLDDDVPQVTEILTLPGM